MRASCPDVDPEHRCKDLLRREIGTDAPTVHWVLGPDAWRRNLAQKMSVSAGFGRASTFTLLAGFHSGATPGAKLEAFQKALEHLMRRCAEGERAIIMVPRPTALEIALSLTTSELEAFEVRSRKIPASLMLTVELVVGQVHVTGHEAVSGETP